MLQPVSIPFSYDIAVVAGGSDFTCVVLEANTSDPAFCWGRNSYQQTGTPPDFSVLNSKLLTPTQGVTHIRTMDAAGFHVCAILHDGPVTCWGRNDKGQLGRGVVTGFEGSGNVIWTR